MNPNTSKLVFLALFTLAGLGALQIPIAKLAGAKAAFTLFDLFAPVAGGFLGSIFGAISVFAMQLGNAIIHGSYDTASLIRLFPMVAATLYFGNKGSLNWIVPLCAIIVFNLHPIGRTVWFFSLFWTIPIVCFFLRERFIFARALGATFSAHAVGGALWIHAFGLPASVWISLIPVVMMERFVFAAGIVASYYAVNHLMFFLKSRNMFGGNVPVSRDNLIPFLRKLAQKNS